MKLLFTYGDAYGFCLGERLDGRDEAELRRARTWAAASTYRRHNRLRRMREIEIVKDQGAEELDGFIVGLAIAWARHVASDHRVPHADADDLAARVGERLLGTMRNAERPWMTQAPAPPALGDWVKTATLNQLRSNLRYRNRHGEVLVDAESFVATLSPRRHETLELSSDLDFIDIINRAGQDRELSIEDRKVVLMLSQLDMTQVETARALGVSPQAVHQRLRRIQTKSRRLAEHLVPT